MKASTAIPSVLFLFFGFIVVSDGAHSQVLPDKKKPADVSGQIKGLDPKDLPKAQGPAGRIAGVSNPEVLSVKRQYTQGRGDVDVLELSFFASIRNPGTTSRAFRIVAELDGGRGFRSGPFSVPAGQTSRRPIRFSSEFDNPVAGNRMPISIILQDLEGAELDRVGRMIDPGTHIRARDGAMRLASPRDLSIVDVRIETIPRFERPGNLAKIGVVDKVHPGITKANVTVRNSGTARWGYHASLSIQFQQGRPGTLQPITGTAGLTKPIPGGLRPGELGSYELVINRGLAPGFYYTATITINSRDDQYDENNTQSITFFVENDGTLTTP